MTINCNGNLIDLSTPKVMGILNLTPDSFYDGGSYKDENDIVTKVDKMLADGATFIDVGAYSSRPNATNISVDEEINRIVPVVKLLVKKFPGIILSIDTFRSAVAKACLNDGAALINDISAGALDDKMMSVIAEYKVPYIMMHMRGTPETMQQLTTYTNVTLDIKQYFAKKLAEARALGIIDLVVDPGFGFAKTTEQNFSVLQNLDLFKTMNVPVLAGISRKSMIYKTLDTTANNALNGTTALNTIALTKGANILRVHDVKEAVECITLYTALQLNETL
ncbi:MULTISPECIES: dihydropteroate synthase [unclassified Cellulophaga]|uniref:dihydropteroate synthase n=1 Tax=unclassified Cellulophaga TaxID=2634405 RepID=UPI0026E39106|nr:MULTISPECIES: dihydropteroate synthase [unclassified Cellulophaga]MDO6492341.1 dihydropteroate synthase [Cellulophaga sp. 2_MG-2023]MDO6496159.1 dihydropteroate synthase [Cellulophaga sp. 3_MG-2023]